VAEYHYPVTANTSYTCHVWFLDNDPAGRARPFIDWSSSSSTWTAPYTADQAGWQEITVTATAAAGDTWATCGVRFYDVAAPFTTATVLIDDMSITSP